MLYLESVGGREEGKRNRAIRNSVLGYNKVNYPYRSVSAVVKPCQAKHKEAVLLLFLNVVVHNLSQFKH